MKKFWDFIRNEEGGRILRLDGPIDEDSFWGDEVTPKAFREELEAEEGDVTVWINSPGGNVFAAAEIYTMLCDHKGRITVKIDAIAASAASVCISRIRSPFSPPKAAMNCPAAGSQICRSSTAGMRTRQATLPIRILISYCRSTIPAVTAIP